MKLIIEYSDSDEALCLPDLKVKEWVDKLIFLHGSPKETDYRTIVGTEAMINAVRLAVYRGQLPPEDVVFVFRDEELVMNKEARIEHWPTGFCDTTEIILGELLGG